jgi:hypothetical protein
VRTLLIVVIALASAVAWSCARRVEAATVEIEARPISREAARGESVAAVESGRHAIQVRRTIRVPDPCRTLSGDLREAGGELTLQVVAAPDGRECVEAESYLAYTARIEGRAPGRYELRVVHAPLRAPGRARAPLEQPVLVMENTVQVR